MELPLLIGGATTSRQHTAVRIAPEYSQSTVHVPDASRVVGVVSDLLDPARKEVARSRQPNRPGAPPEVVRRGVQRPLLPYRKAVGNRTPIVWHPDDLTRPPFTGTRIAEPPLATLRDYIDWTFFFSTWELKGRFPAILDHPRHGSAARELYGRANELLERLVTDGSLAARGVYGYWRAWAEGDDVVLENGMRFPMLRQQVDHGDMQPNRSLADYVTPADTGLADHIGAFAVTAGLGADEVAEAFRAKHDDYDAIMVKAVADRLAEAFAEYLHEVSRREWYETGPKMTRRGADRGALPRHPAGVRVPGVTRPLAEAETVRSPRRRVDRHGPDRNVRDDAGRQRVRAVPRASGRAVLQCRTDRPRPGRGLRPSPRRTARRGRALAPPEPRVRAPLSSGRSLRRHRR